MSAEKKSPLPLEKMPACWSQEERMSALFSPFRSKSANPQDWISKYQFWSSLIYEWLKYTGRCEFCIMDLNEAFKRNGCTPLCLTMVVEELLRNNEIILEDGFMKEPCETWTAWSIDVFVKRPFNWLLSKVKNYVVNQGSNVEAKYIHLQVVKELGDSVFSILRDKKINILISFPEIVNYYKCNVNDKVHDKSIMFALIWLRTKKKVALKNSSDEKELLIKMIVNVSDNITETEEGLYKLTKLEEKLEEEIQTMEKEKVNIIKEVKQHLSSGLRHVAKTHLKKKVRLEKTIEKRVHTLDNLRSLIMSIQDTNLDTAVLSAYKTGSNILKKLAENGFTESNVRDIIDEFAESLDEHNEAQSILSDSIKSNESDADLELELAELLESNDTTLPEPPDTDINSKFEELEKRLEKLNVQDTPVSNRSLPTPKSVTDHRKSKVLMGPECS